MSSSTMSRFISLLKKVPVSVLSSTNRNLVKGVREEIGNQSRCISSLASFTPFPSKTGNARTSVLCRLQPSLQCQVQPCRGRRSVVPRPNFLIRVSKKKGKLKTMKDVTKRFFRLDYGIWIRPRTGRDTNLWKRPARDLYNLRQHVFCSKTYSRMFDKMVSPYWKKKRYYIDDIYEPYQKRHGIIIGNPTKKVHKTG